MFTFFLGLRYAAGRNPNQLVSFLSRLSMAALVLGVALLVVVMSVMNGFDREMRQRILGLVPQVTLTPFSSETDWQHTAEQAMAHSEVVAAAPFIELSGLLLRARDAQPAIIYAVDPELEGTVSVIEDYVDLKLLNDASDKIPVILGDALAEKLGVQVGSATTLAIPKENGKRARITFERVRVVATIKTGTELDQGLLMMNIHHVAQLPIPQPVSAVRLKIVDLFNAPTVAFMVNNSLTEPHQSSDWTQQFGNMYQAIQLSRQMVSIMLISVIAVAVFNVVATLVMVVNDKQGDIAILRSQGASPAQILGVFMVYGGTIGAIGCLVGGLSGVVFSLGITDIVRWIEWQFNLQFLQSDVYPVSYLPSDLRMADIALVCGVSWLMSLLATVYPAWRASRVPPAEALRFKH